MYDLFMSKGNNENEDDAMFTKKPLGGTSCASCAKDVIDMYAHPNWKQEFLNDDTLTQADKNEIINNYKHKLSEDEKNNKNVSLLIKKLNLI